jgi:hypothetical protein
MLAQPDTTDEFNVYSGDTVMRFDAGFWLATKIAVSSGTISMEMVCRILVSLVSRESM